MASEGVGSLVEEVTTSLDKLEEALKPLLETPLSNSAGKSPLLDKAKLYVLSAYATESVLFSALRLNGVDARSHPVFKELARVKAYYEKIEKAETAGSKPTARLDREAASRFIKHGLSGNEQHDRRRAEQKDAERANAKRKLEQMQVGKHTKFADDDTADEGEVEGAQREVRRGEVIVPECVRP